MTFFPRSGSTQMLLATAYRPNGRFAAFSGPLDVETETALVEAPAPTRTQEVSAAAQEKEASAETDLATPAPARSVEDIAPAETPAAASFEQVSDAEVDAAGLIGTPEEIEAINAEKRSVAPADGEEPETPETGLRIDIAGNAGVAMIRELAGDFLLGQSEVTASQASVEQQNDGIRLVGEPEAPLQRIELLNSDPAVAFTKLFDGEIDLVLSSTPI